MLTVLYIDSEEQYWDLFHQVMAQVLTYGPDEAKAQALMPIHIHGSRQIREQIAVPIKNQLREDLEK